MAVPPIRFAFASESGGKPLKLNWVHEIIEDYTKLTYIYIYIHIQEAHASPPTLFVDEMRARDANLL